MKNLRELWGAKETHKKELRKLEPLPTPLRTGRIVSYENFCNIGKRTDGNLVNTGNPTIVDQWFSLLFEITTKNELKQEITISWIWQNKPTVLYYFKSPEISLDQLQLDKLPEDILEGKKISTVITLL